MRKTLFLMIIIIFVFTLTGCSSNKISTTKNLDSWIGTYRFYESVPAIAHEEPNMSWVYEIEIFKKEREYYANLYVDGHLTITRLRAKVIGNKETIDFLFESYLPNNQIESFNKGDVLLSFKKESFGISTNWGILKPILVDNGIPNKIYFEKDFIKGEK